MASILRLAAIWSFWIALTVVIPLVALAEGRASDPVPAAAFEDALTPPPPSAALNSLIGRSRGPSQFMAGKVAILLILPESDGGSEPSTENWTPAQVAHITGQVQAGLDWWQRRLPLAHLQFSLHPVVVSTTYEPINHDLNGEGLWIGDLLARMGYQGGNYFDQAYQAIYDLRDRQGADWATAIFVVNSEQNREGRFRDGRFAYAYVGGPFLVMTSDAGAYGTSQLAAVAAHELGHSFGALDQYAAARVNCTRASGYLSMPTSNSQTGGCSTVVPSIMLEPITAFAQGAVDPSALAQLGYRDSDNDQLIDPLDTSPLLEATLQSPAEGRPTISGEAVDHAYPSPLQRSVSINVIERVEYRVNGGLWQGAEALDGAFDSGEEAFHAELPLYDGQYNIELRAVNSMEIASETRRFTATVSGIGMQPAYGLELPALSSSPTVTLNLQAPADTAALQVSESSAFVDANWQPFAASLLYRLTNGTDGRKQLYVRFRDAEGRVSLAYGGELVIDTVPPTGRAFLDTPLEVGHLRLSAADALSTVEAVEVVVESGEPRWLPYAEEITLAPTTAGARPAATAAVWVRFRDSAGNISPAYRAASLTTLYLPLITANEATP